MPGRRPARSASPDERRALVGLADGTLVLAELPSGATTAAFSLLLLHGATDSERMARPLSALAWASDGVLLAQRGSAKILYCPSPESLGPGEAAPLFLFGAVQQGAESAQVVL